MTLFERGTVVVVTHNRRVQLLQALRALERLVPEWPVIVVDNGSSDGTARAVSRDFPAVLLIRSRRNIGAAARNIAVAYVHTPFVAFCDDSVMWEPGALQRAVGVLEQHSAVGVVSARVLLGDTDVPDPACVALAASPLGRRGLPGPQVLDFTASACVMRTRAFYEAGGYWPPLFIGGEEALLAMDLAQRGWQTVYLDEVVARRDSGRARQGRSLERRRLRNAIWVAWMRLPMAMAWTETLAVLRSAARRRLLRSVLMLTMPGMMRAFKARHVVSPRVAQMRKLFSSGTGAAQPSVGQAPRGSMA